MTSSARSVRVFFFLVVAGLLGLLSAFFVFYTVRLLYVTHGLRTIRAGGQGAYIGAIVFPMLAVILGWGAWRCVRTLRRAQQ